MYCKAIYQRCKLIPNWTVVYGCKWFLIGMYTCTIKHVVLLEASQFRGKCKRI